MLVLQKNHVSVEFDIGFHVCSLSFNGVGADVQLYERETPTRDKRGHAKNEVGCQLIYFAEAPKHRHQEAPSALALASSSRFFAHQAFFARLFRFGVLVVGSCGAAVSALALGIIAVRLTLRSWIAIVVPNAKRPAKGLFQSVVGKMPGLKAILGRLYADVTTYEISLA